MSINLKIVAKQVLTYWSQIDFGLKSGDDYVELRASIKAAKYYDDDIGVRIRIYDNAVVHAFFVLDKLSPSMDVFTLINEFNDNHAWARCYLSEKQGGTFLELHYSCFNLSSDDATAEAVNFIIQNLLDDTTVKYLTPLTQITV